MLQLCVCRDIEHLGSLESNQEAVPRATLTPLSCSPNFPRAQYISRHTHADACQLLIIRSKCFQFLNQDGAISVILRLFQMTFDQGFSFRILC